MLIMGNKDYEGLGGGGGGRITKGWGGGIGKNRSIERRGEEREDGGREDSL